MPSRLLVSFRRLSLNPTRSSLCRTLATVVPDSSAATSSKPSSPEWQTRPPRKLTAKERAIPGRVKLEAETPDGHLRPHLGIKVNPNHGLYGFFRQVRNDDGTMRYETLEEKHRTNDWSGRPWMASELRRKSFKDLHTLWYVLARERNLLATQKHEARRQAIDVSVFTNINMRNMRCRKSMARIKQVLNERRLAYEAAVELHKEGVTPEQLEAAEAESVDARLAQRGDPGMLESEPSQPEAQKV
ncbi:Mitochondrial 39-S ribosomal protein L47 (MRP-L47) [Ceratobasidium sp. AG-Ba]|nr:Mitochondrial 39-S ribosomal protein L47 (MRP-L47) [Ceratobasidium sp. AG-Ba]